ncbi:uncharacterized protein LOC62_01G000142 [Vanrija pseudolonga]|uniref:Uncharacterized protein n=1 Tax=Vanrija pseudolonga TaxID=143232 RepID=A0AAF0Y2S7_9TREE|nr:hypothetical protein LOC62_01G000142 [Vanrija pseudolonga]
MPIRRQATPLPTPGGNGFGQHLQQADKNKPVKIPSDFGRLPIIPKRTHHTRPPIVVPKRERSPSDITLHPRNHSAPPLSTPNYFSRTQPNGALELVFSLPAWPPAQPGQWNRQIHRVEVPALTLADVHAHMPASYPLLLLNICKEFETWYHHIQGLAIKKDILPLAEKTLTGINSLVDRLEWIHTVCAQIREGNRRIAKVMANALAGTDKNGPRANIYDGNKLHRDAVATPLPEVYDDIDNVIAERLVTAGFLFDGAHELLRNFVKTARGVPNDLLCQEFVEDSQPMFDSVNALCGYIKDWSKPLHERILEIKLLDVSDADIDAYWETRANTSIECLSI